MEAATTCNRPQHRPTPEGSLHRFGGCPAPTTAPRTQQRHVGRDNQLPPPHSLQGGLAVLRMPETNAHPQQSPAVGVDQYHEHAVCHSADPARDATGLRCHVFADNQPANTDRSHVPHDSRVLPSQEGGRGQPIQQTRTLESQSSAVGAIGPLGLWHATDKQGCNRSDDDDGIAPCGSPLTVHRDSTGLSRGPCLVPPRQGKPTRKSEAQPTVRCPEEPDAGRIVRKVADEFRADVRRGHANLVAYVLDSTPATNRWYGGRDLFANVGCEAAQKGHNAMEIKFWGKRGTADVPFAAQRRIPVCTKTGKERVPPYRFHHVPVARNILAPNTMLSFVPHLRDLRPPEEEKYLDWLKQLRDMDRQSGFQPLDDKAKRKMASQRERVAILSLYLDAWLEQLAVPERDTPTLLNAVVR
ncbi:hypothetical protein Purlil1_14287 [Purpureocillium lilacinum]|uniref:EZH2 N-terminal domain-containing protein n=1 Tax=Purpureocillium lilacinum TaxID=33203 RepID=A0ABR0BBQ4_PURLI|nr:hypothetical protein Purlil1_14287 [Purpureocillium lilacinum]